MQTNASKTTRAKEAPDAGRRKVEHTLAYPGNVSALAFQPSTWGDFFKVPPMLVGLGKDPSVSHSSDGAPEGLRAVSLVEAWHVVPPGFPHRLRLQALSLAERGAVNEAPLAQMLKSQA